VASLPPRCTPFDLVYEDVWNYPDGQLEGENGWEHDYNTGDLSFNVENHQLVSADPFGSSNVNFSWLPTMDPAKPWSLTFTFIKPAHLTDPASLKLSLGDTAVTAVYTETQFSNTAGHESDVVMSIYGTDNNLVTSATLPIATPGQHVIEVAYDGTHATVSFDGVVRVTATAYVPALMTVFGVWMTGYCIDPTDGLIATRLRAVAQA